MTAALQAAPSLMQHMAVSYHLDETHGHSWGDLYVNPWAQSWSGSDHPWDSSYSWADGDTEISV